MNYSIIFTEISFSRETSFLLQLQIMTNNSYNILDTNQNLTDSMGSSPIWNPKDTTQNQTLKKFSIVAERA